MARLIRPLTLAQINNARPREKTYKLFDGGGLFLQVTPAGGKHWKMKYRQANGKEGLLSFGPYPALSLDQARRKRDEARAQRVSGLDPGEVRRQEKAQAQSLAQNTFRAVSAAWLELARAKVTRRSYKNSKRLLEKRLLPALGHLPVNALRPGDFLDVFRRIEATGALATSRKAGQACSGIMRYAIALGLVEIDPIPSINILLHPYRARHFSAIIEPGELGRLLVRLDAYGAKKGSLTVKTAIRIMPYVFVRTTELTHARWGDINFATREWRYTVSKTKTPHIVPLAPQVIALLKELEAVTGGGEYVFPNARDARRPISGVTMIGALRRMGVSRGEMTVHGFRATARTLLDEVLGERYDLIEHQLAHAVRDPNGRAYNRTAHLAERKRMMTRWADYLDSLRATARGEALPSL
ncbi:MAG: integrase arm-type DNA-binding domain-containing protein [Desulfovibrionaceae bacterium]|nr:integrase arm-type DNA-binding domain-containing protein [Desulfovibrionaceae bacterium]